MARPPHEIDVASIQNEMTTSDSRYGVTYHHAYADVVQLYDRSYSGTRTPNFKGIRKAALPFNDYSLELVRLSPARIFWSTVSVDCEDIPNRGIITVAGSGSKWMKTYVSGALGIDHLDDAEYGASESLARKFNTIKTNLPMLFKERKKSADMILKTAGRIVHAVNSLRKLQFGAAYASLGFKPSDLTPNLLRNVTRKEGKIIYDFRSWHKRNPETKERLYIPPENLISELWLEISFGWKPLLEDIFKSSELMRKQYEDPNTRYQASGGYTSNLTVPVSIHPTEFCYWLSPKRSGISTKSTTCKYITIYSCDSEARSKLAQSGITNPLLVAWDVLPFSFIVDWFLPVNNYLKAMESYSGFTLQAVKRVRMTKVTTQATSSNARVVKYGNKGTFEYHQAVGGWNEEGLHYTRDSIAAPVTVPLQFRDPFKSRDPKDPLATNLFSLYTTTALLIQAFSSYSRL